MLAVGWGSEEDEGMSRSVAPSRGRMVGGAAVVMSMSASSEASISSSWVWSWRWIWDGGGGSWVGCESWDGSRSAMLSLETSVCR